MRRYLLAIAAAAFAAAAPTAVQAQYVSPQSQAMVNDWYNRFLHRPAGPTATNWAYALDQGQSPEQLVAGILGSDEYYSRCGSTPQGYIQTLFTDINGRQPSAAEDAFWINQLVQIGGPAPDSQERTDVAYAMLTRYPQAWAPATPLVVAPPTVIAPIYNYGRRYGDHDNYEYRRPVLPYVRIDRDHREGHDHHDDHHDEHDRRK